MEDRRNASESESSREAEGLSPDHPVIDDAAESELPTLVEKLQAGELSQQQQVRLGYLIEEVPPQTLMMVTRHEVNYSGDLPHPDQLNAYDAETRKIIVQMVVDDQKHVHDMQRTGLGGAIAKDKRAQQFGLTIALVGLVAATCIAPFSAGASMVIGGLDLFGMVALFVAPRVLEVRAKNKASAENSQQ